MAKCPFFKEGFFGDFCYAFGEKEREEVPKDWRDDKCLKHFFGCTTYAIAKSQRQQ